MFYFKKIILLYGEEFGGVRLEDNNNLGDYKSYLEGRIRVKT